MFSASILKTQLLKSMKNSLTEYASALHRPAHDQKVLSNWEDFVSRVPLWRRLWLRAKRDLILALTLQLRFARSNSPPTARRVLYIYLGTPNLGDSIMDLSPRVLWKEKEWEVDMLTSPTIVNFYHGDPSFHRITSKAKELARNYDFIILHSYSWQCIKIKLRYFFRAHYATLHGHYYGCEFDRFSFSEGAWRKVLGLKPNQPSKNISPIFNQKYSKAISSPRADNVIAVALGGIVEWRIYPRWGEVIRLVSEKLPNINWLLLGSDNALSQAASLTREATNANSLFNQVGKLSLDQIFQQLRIARVLIAADGGLLNLGRAADIPLVGLFARDIHPRLRLRDSDKAIAIHASGAVEEICPALISKKVFEVLECKSESCLRLCFLDAEPRCAD